MEQLFKALYAAGHKSFDLSIERLVVLLRIVLTLFCLLTAAADTRPPVHAIKPFIIVLAIYVIFGICVAILPIVARLRTGWQLPVHFVDVGIISVLMSLSHVLSTTSFVLYIFALLSATFRWNFDGAFGTTVSLFILQGISNWNDIHTVPLVLQLSFIVTIGGVFMFFGASRAHNEKRLAQIAAWPETATQQLSESEDQWLIDSISHLSKVLQAPRIMVLWEIAQEPYHFLLTFADGTCQKELTFGEEFENPIAVDLADKTFAIETADTNYYVTSNGIAYRKKPIIDKAFQERFNIRSLCNAPFSGHLCKGRMFFLDRIDWRDED